MNHVIVLDNEAVQALGDTSHPKHARVVSHLQIVAQRKRRALPIRTVVPTTVRAEAGWDRSSPAWAFANRLRIEDVPLDRVHADTAAQIRTRTAVSVADAHIGAVIGSVAADRITVLTSDDADMRLVADTVPIIVVHI